nr:unnamed protein product [Digitaria exilis]
MHFVGIKGAKASGAKAVAVPSLQSQRQHYSIADVILYSLLDFDPELWGLPPFEDRIYLGWAKSKVPGFSKVVIGTGWDFSQQTIERVMD